MSQHVPRTSKEIIAAANANNWEGVLLGLGCKLSLKGQDQEGDQSASWEDILRAVKADFWGANVRLAQGKVRRNSFDPLLPDEVVKSGVFGSLNIELTGTPINLKVSEEFLLMMQALDSDDWAALTALLFFFCGRAGISSALIEATRRAVKAKDWRYVDAVAVDFKKYHVVESSQFLAVLGLRDVFHVPNKREQFVRDLLANNEWDSVVLEIIVKAIAMWCSTYRDGDDLSTWTIAMEFMEEFDCETEINQEFVAKCLHHSCQRGITAEEVLTLALQEEKTYLLRGLGDQMLLTEEQTKRAVMAAYNAQDWLTVFSFFGSGEVDRRFFPTGKDALFQAVKINKFQLTKDWLPQDIDVTQDGYTLLHTAVDRWQDDSSQNIVPNIILLLENNADASLKDPSGLTVLQKLVDKRKDRPNNQRSQLIVSAVNAVNQDDREIDWTPEPAEEWNALHVLCDEGDFGGVALLLRVGADPFQHRKGLTLFDTAILSKKHGVALKRHVCKELLGVPGLVQDHLDTVRNRPVVDDSQYRFPLIHLLQLIDLHWKNFQLILFLHEHGVIADIEFQDAKKESIISSLREMDLDNVIAFIHEQGDRKSEEKK